MGVTQEIPSCLARRGGAGAGIFAAVGAKADPIPKGGQGEHVKVIGFSGLDGRYGGFKIAIKHTANDKWYLYTGHSFNQGWSIVDVTDPAQAALREVHPVQDRRQEHHHRAGDAARQSDDHLAQQLHAAEEAAAGGAAVGHQRSGKSQAGRLAGWAAPPARIAIPIPAANTPISRPAIPGFKGNIMVILDVSDPAHPKDVGKWWQPGQKDGEPAAD